MTSEKTIVNSEKAPAPIGPYNQARWAGSTLYVSGQIPLNAESGNLENDTIEAATHRVMKNVGFILHQAGLDFDDLVKCTILLTDINDFQQVNEVYGQYFTNISPAREAFQVTALPKGAKVEISAIAYKN